MKEAVKLMKNTQNTHTNVQEGMKVVKSTPGDETHTYHMCLRPGVLRHFDKTQDIHSCSQILFACIWIIHENKYEVTALNI